MAIMDIATHAIAGAVIALPFLPMAPWSATCFILGSVLPDIDALSRLFGKIAFLRWHQTSMYKASYHWWNWKPPAGFRFSFTDAIAIAVCLAAVWALFPVLGNMVWLFPVVLGHFFLFCNIFRVPRFLELFWSGIFLLNVGFWFAIDRFSWIAILETQCLPTVVVILLAILRKDYHGICYWLVPWGRRPVDSERK